MDLLPFFQWCYSTPIGEGIRNSTWLFPVIEAFHLLGLGLTAGAVLIVDLRLLGVGLRKQTAAQLWANAQPWLLGSLTIMVASGTPLFLFTFTVLRRVVQMDLSDRPLLRRSTALVSLVLWFGVAWGGRWIGFS